MSILTKKEREDVYKYWLHSSTLTNEDGLIQLAERAVLEKLAGMELPEPAPYVPVYRPLFTAAQLHQAFAQGAASVLSEKPVVWAVESSKKGIPTFGKGWMFSPVQQLNAKLPLYTLKEPS